MKALWFSGGKDSMACWHLYRHEDPIVLFVNTGRCYPEQLAVVDDVRKQSRNFVEIKTDRVGQWAKNGIPSDVVPIDWTILGQQVSGKKRVTIQSYLGCCFENISGPLMAKTKELGCVEVICGQRKEEGKKAPRSNGDVVDGIKFIQPIEDWTTEDVMAFLRSRGPIPEHFILEHSSMDCFDCAAYAKHSVDRVKYMKARHPELYAEYRIAAEAVRSAVAEAMEI